VDVPRVLVEFGSFGDGGDDRWGDELVWASRRAAGVGWRVGRGRGWGAGERRRTLRASVSTKRVCWSGPASVDGGAVEAGPLGDGAWVKWRRSPLFLPRDLW